MFTTPRTITCSKSGCRAQLESRDTLDLVDRRLAREAKRKGWRKAASGWLCPPHAKGVR